MNNYQVVDIDFCYWRHTSVLDVEFPVSEELITPADAMSQLKTITETSPRIVVFTNQLYRLRLRGLNRPIKGNPRTKPSGWRYFSY